MFRLTLKKSQENEVTSDEVYYRDNVQFTTLLRSINEQIFFETILKNN